jgi:hypothetical protein
MTEETPVVDTSDIQTYSPTHPESNTAADQPAATDQAPAVTTEADTAAGEPKDKKDGEATADDEDGPKPGESPQQFGARTRSRNQKRIDELTAKRYTAEGRAAQLERDNADLRRQLSGTAAPANSDAKPATPAAASADADPTAPYQAKPFEKTADDFDTYELYLDARDSHLRAEVKAELVHETKAERAREERDRAEGERRARVEGSLERTRKFTESTPDFLEAINGLTFRVHDVVADEMHDSEYGPQIIYALAKDPEEAAKFAGLSTAKQVRYIGARDSEFARASKASGTPADPPARTAPRRPQSNAPAPLNPVATPSATATKSIDQMTSDERMDFWDRQKRANGR